MDLAGHTTVSLVIPTFKEDDLVANLDRILAYLATVQGHVFEILLADDSSEPYRHVIRRYGEAHRGSSDPAIRLIEGRHVGKGDANRLGILASTGDVVFTMDADIPVPLAHIGEFLQILATTTADFVIAERPFSRNQTPLRFVLSRGLFFLQRAVVFPSSHFRDTQCGFKAYRGEVIRKIAGQQVLVGGMCDIEYLYAAVRQGRSIARVPVIPTPERRESKINAWKEMFAGPTDLFRVKVRGMLGKYD